MNNLTKINMKKTTKFSQKQFKGLQYIELHITDLDRRTNLDKCETSSQLKSKFIYYNFGI